MFLEQLKTLRYGFTDEISMSVYVPVQTAATAVQLQQPQANTIDQVDTDENDDIIIVKKFATVLGNVELEKSHNESLRKEIESYVAINPNLIKNIAVKRTMGMGDVALVQPFLKYIIEKYPQAKLTFYTSKERSCQDIAKLFPEYINNKFVIDDVENNQLTTDFLGQKIEYDLKYDLDLSYESRKDLTLNYAHSYFKVAGYDIPENLHMELAPISLSDDRISPAVKQFIQNNEGNYISCNLKASGWGGKELEANMVDKILNQLKEQNLKLAAVSEFASHNTYNRLLSKFDYSNAAENFYDMMALIQYSSGYVGADSGPMHVAAAYNKKLLLWQGAVLVKNTTLIDLENVIPIIKEELKCLGCKHNFFFNEIKTSNNTSTISFVPPCIARYNYICMNDYEENYLKDQTNKFVSLIKN